MCCFDFCQKSTNDMSMWKKIGLRASRSNIHRWLKLTAAKTCITSTKLHRVCTIIHIQRANGMAAAAAANIPCTTSTANGYQRNDNDDDDDDKRRRALYLIEVECFGFFARSSARSFFLCTKRKDGTAKKEKTDKKSKAWKEIKRTNNKQHTDRTTTRRKLL